MDNSDRLKFRAWDPRINKMRAIESICFDTWDIAFNDDGGIKRQSEVIKYRYTQVWKDKIVIMQSTGLTDSNGVEIYEGDIVQSWCDWGNTDDGIHEVIFMGCMFELTPRAIKSLFRMWIDSDEFPIKVIGNRFESPELLHTLDKE